MILLLVGIIVGLVILFTGEHWLPKKIHFAFVMIAGLITVVVIITIAIIQGGDGGFDPSCWNPKNC